MRTLELIVTPDQAGRTVRSLLKQELRLSSHAVSRLTRRETGILLDGVRAFTTAVVRAGDVLTVEIGDGRTDGGGVPPLDIPLDILYEDEDVLAVNKPAGMAVHASSLTPETPTLDGALAARWGGPFVFHPVNRLDKGTTGVMLVAKSGYVHELLRRALHSADLCREYRAVVVGRLDPPAGIVDAPIGREAGSVIRRCVAPDGASAVTRYETLWSDGAFSLVRLLPETGRTHQLRLHMAHLGCPLAGDWLYGTEDKALIPRPALHSCHLRLTHPITGVSLSLAAPLPEDMRRLIKYSEV